MYRGLSFDNFLSSQESWLGRATQGSQARSAGPQTLGDPA